MTDTRSEKAILNDVMCDRAINPPHGMNYRQNTGTAWQGEPVDMPVGHTVRVEPGMKILRRARPITFGCPGAGDVLATAKGRAIQIETKTLTGPQRETQQRFERAWTKVGGIYILARSVAELRAKLRLALG